MNNTTCSGINHFGLFIQWFSFIRWHWLHSSFLHATVLLMLLLSRFSFGFTCWLVSPTCVNYLPFWKCRGIKTMDVDSAVSVDLTFFWIQESWFDNIYVSVLLCINSFNFRCFEEMILTNFNSTIYSTPWSILRLDLTLININKVYSPFLMQVAVSFVQYWY